MTRIIAFFLLVPSFLFAQAPDRFNYQSIVRDNGGTPITNQSVSFRMSILESNITGAVVYSETHQVATNDFGAASFLIGSGLIVHGDFTTIDWGSDSYFLKTELDVSGATNYVELGTAQLVSVPYALYAKEAGTTNSGRTYLNLFGDITDAEAAINIESHSGPNTQILQALYTTQLTEIEASEILELEDLQIHGNESLNSLSLPNVSSLGGNGSYGQIATNSALTVLNLTNLEFVSKELRIYGNALQSIDLPSLTFARRIHFNNEPLLSSVNLSNLTGTGRLYIHDNPNLTTIILSSFDFSQYQEDLRLNDNALSSTVVNQILAQLVADNVIGIEINLHGQTPAAPPTGQGIIDKQTLIGNGNTVTTD